MLNKFIFLFVCLLTTEFLYSQSKLADLGFGIKPGNPKGLLSFNFSFNRTEAAETKPGGYLFSKNKVFGEHDRIYMQPSAEANLGNVESSPNNILLQLPLEYTLKVKPGQSFFVDVAPAFNSSKNLDTGLYYLETGVKYLFYDIDNKVGYFFLPEFSIQPGKRFNTNFNDAFVRYVPSLKVSLLFIQNSDKTHRLEITGNFMYYIINNDKLAPKQSLPLFSGSASYKFKNLPLGLIIKYINGYDQPVFNKMNAITFGISFYRS